MHQTGLSYTGQARYTASRSCWNKPSGAGRQNGCSGSRLNFP